MTPGRFAQRAGLHRDTVMRLFQDRARKLRDDVEVIETGAGYEILEREDMQILRRYDRNGNPLWYLRADQLYMIGG